MWEIKAFFKTKLFDEASCKAFDESFIALVLYIDLEIAW
jgi:hypothetical protein